MVEDVVRVIYRVVSVQSFPPFGPAQGLFPRPAEELAEQPLPDVQVVFPHGRRDDVWLAHRAASWHGITLSTMSAAAPYSNLYCNGRRLFGTRCPSTAFLPTGPTTTSLPLRPESA